ncbi:alpha/beta hydrolase family protein [Chryseobacterium sp. FH1]|uniref:alpha/beta hydrolase family protein n=1 Tax=Chryseobacterium sp. FH1 TaxID=1233951 RepID=UPI0004E37722|nr:prolyl oligopeptidase family serine peptidase [Chryseobacterium sp. FH1]KFC19698.1 hypothetical protein IO90_10550 [Chryseobacterium sp. FH1]
MVIRILALALMLIHGLYLSQNIDSVDNVYRKYHVTALLTASPSGRHVVLNHYNIYGKDEDELFDVRSGKGITLEKHLKYQFLGDDRLLMTNIARTRFHDLKRNLSVDVAGNYVATIADASGQVVLHDAGAKVLALASKDGKVIWKVPNVKNYQLDNERGRLIYVAGDELWTRELKNGRSKTYMLDSEIQWLSFSANRIYCANIRAARVELYTLDLLSDKLEKELIDSPEAFEFASSLTSYFEIREDGKFIFPFYMKSKLHEKKDPELKITYSNRNSRDKVMNYHMGIYDLGGGRWDYRPDERIHLPMYRFLNGKGDFIVYDQGGDIVEEQQNVVLDFQLVLDYGKSSHILPKKRVEDGNYLWDRNTRQFIYFDRKRWWSHNIGTGADQELLPLDSEGWESRSQNGLVQAPETNPVLVKGRSAIILSNQHDYFLVDLEIRRSERITKGGDQQVKYSLQLSKDQYPRSSWTLKLAEVDLGKELTFKLFNEISYDSGFATYLYGKQKTRLFRQGHYKEMIPYRNGLFFTSDFALEPFKLTKVEQGKYAVVYESLKTEKKDLESMRHKVFQYKTRYGTANAAVMFPMGYDKNKKYPMVVNVYEKFSLFTLDFVPPYLRTNGGFNYLHYLMNGYIVLYPDLQYETSNVKNSVMTSLEKSIDTVKLLASVDEKNIGILGMSYGGYETGLALTSSKYFKTGVAGAMISDLVTHALSNNEFRPYPNYMRTENQQMRMGNNVFDDWSSYLESSPVYHMKNIDAPVLIWNGSKDKNVPPAQSKMFFIGMKRLQKKAVLLEYANETHNILSAPNQLDLDIRTWQWFDHYLKKKSPADWIEPLTK